MYYIRLVELDEFSSHPSNIGKGTLIGKRYISKHYGF